MGYWLASAFRRPRPRSIDSWHSHRYDTTKWYYMNRIIEEKCRHNVGKARPCLIKIYINPIICCCRVEPPQVLPGITHVVSPISRRLSKKYTEVAWRPKYALQLSIKILYVFYIRHQGISQTSYIEMQTSTFLSCYRPCYFPSLLSGDMQY